MFDCFTLLSSMSEKATAPHSRTLAWKIPWAEEPGRLQSMGSLRVGHDWATSLSLFLFHALEKEMATQSSVHAWKIPGAGEPGGLMSMGSHRVRHDWSDLAAAVAVELTRQKTWINYLLNNEFCIPRETSYNLQLQINRSNAGLYWFFMNFR